MALSVDCRRPVKRREPYGAPFPPSKRKKSDIAEELRICEVVFQVLQRVVRVAESLSADNENNNSETIPQENKCDFSVNVVNEQKDEGSVKCDKKTTSDSKIDKLSENLKQNLPRFSVQTTEHLFHLYRQLNAVINTQQMCQPSRRQSRLSLVSDEVYEQHYKTWLDFLERYATIGLSISDKLRCDFLRTLLISNGGAIIKDLAYCPLKECALSIFWLLCEASGISASDAELIIDDMASNNLVASDKKSILASETGLGFLTRDSGGAAEEISGIITFECITNDRQPASMMKLATLKNIFSRQLPKMPREYIVRLLFDRTHFSFCLLKKGRLIGGTCFRPYFSQGFAEIAFLAVTSTEQVKGYGTRLMNHLKEHIKRVGIDYFLTYADNFAIGYFRKQGFTQKISMPRERWHGYIKDYDGGTLMECYINSNINYLRLSEMLAEQKREVRRAIRHVKPQKAYPSLSYWKDNPSAVIHPSDIPGLVQAGWKEQPSLRDTKGVKPLYDAVLAVLDILNRHENAWPFRKPVSTYEAPDYLNVIKRPMDISTMRKLARKMEYKTKAQFIADLRTMFSNCRTYNHSSTIYYKYAQELEAFITPKLEAIPED